MGRSISSLKRKAFSLQQSGKYPNLIRDKYIGYKKENRKSKDTDWTESEMQDLEVMYSEATIEELETRFKRKMSAIRSQVKRNGLPPRNNELAQARKSFPSDGWTKEEDSFLEKLYAESEFTSKFIKSFQKVYPNRSKAAIHQRIKSKKLSYLRSSPLKDDNYWSKDQVDFLRQNYDKLSWKDLESTIGKSHKAIQDKMHHFKLQRPKELFWREGMWSKEDLEVLYKMWPESNIVEIFERFPNRTYESLKCKASGANITRLVKNSTSEIFMKRILDDIFPKEKYEDNKRYDWLRSTISGSKMELDRYYPNLKLAFEYDGEQHYNVNAFYAIASTRGQNITMEQSQKEYQHYIANDKIKKELCLKHNVRLIIIRYDEEVSEEAIRKKIFSKINKKKVIQ